MSVSQVRGKTVLVRADASPRFGMGHVMRCVALAQALKDQGHQAVFLSRFETAAANDVLKENNIPWVALSHQFKATTDAQATLQVAKNYGSTGIVVDLNHAGTLSDVPAFIEYLMLLQRGGLHVAAIEGMGQECLSIDQALPVAEVIVPYFGAKTLKCHLQAGSTFLGGEEYFLFRSDFVRKSQEIKNIVPQARRILISMGGGDVSQLNEKAIKAVFMLADPTLDVKVTGQLPDWVLKQAPCRVEVIAQSKDMAGLISWADVAVISSGLTRYETALLGTPAIVLSLNEVHAKIMEQWAPKDVWQHLGVAQGIGVEELAAELRKILADSQRRLLMSQRGKQILDGQGAYRIVTEILRGC